MFPYLGSMQVDSFFFSIPDNKWWIGLIGSEQCWMWPLEGAYSALPTVKTSHLKQRKLSTNHSDVWNRLACQNKKKISWAFAGSALHRSRQVASHRQDGCFCSRRSRPYCVKCLEVVFDGCELILYKYTVNWILIFRIFRHSSSGG